MEANGMQIVNRIDYVLSNKRMNRNDLCRDLNMKSNTLSNWKTRGTIPNADDALLIANYLHVSPTWLIFGEEETKDTRTENLASKFTMLTDSEKLAVETLVDGFLKSKSSSIQNRA